MGFLDKLKEAGKNAAKGALTMAATSYGVVTEGKHKMCKISMNSEHNKLSFIKVAAIEAEYVIKEDIKTFWMHTETDTDYFHEIKIQFNNGEECVVVLTVDQNQGSGLSSPAARLAAHYRNAGVFVKALAKNVPEMSDATREWANKIMRYCGEGNQF